MVVMPLRDIIERRAVSSQEFQTEACVGDIDQLEASRVIAHPVSAVNQQDIMGVTMIRKCEHSTVCRNGLLLFCYSTFSLHTFGSDNVITLKMKSCRP